MEALLSFANIPFWIVCILVICEAFIFAYLDPNDDLSIPGHPRWQITIRLILVAIAILCCFAEPVGLTLNFFGWIVKTIAMALIFGTIWFVLTGVFTGILNTIKWIFGK